tara:strand:- start:75537 stop:76646 length:1110 start_codon:yes stop_codon:yes gene_type:complete
MTLISRLAILTVGVSTVLSFCISALAAENPSPEDHNHKKIRTRHAEPHSRYLIQFPQQELKRKTETKESDQPEEDSPVAPIYTKGGGFQPDKVISFKQIGERELGLDIFYPEGWNANESRPAVLFFFGGGWINGDTLHFYPQAKYLASRGMVAICAEYRTESSDGAKPPECVEDAKSAMRFVRSNASTLGIDPDRIAAGGGSAGGHLAAATATLDQYNCKDDDLSVSPVPNALLLFNPACDNSEYGYGYDRVSEYWQSFSPMENLDRKVPPSIIFLGDEDSVFPLDRAKIYKQRMIAGGNRCELLIYPRQRHGFFRLDRKTQDSDPNANRRYFLATAEAMDRFLISLGFLSAEPTVKSWLSNLEAQPAK